VLSRYHACPVVPLVILIAFPRYVAVARWKMWLGAAGSAVRGGMVLESANSFPFRTTSPPVTTFTANTQEPSELPGTFAHGAVLYCVGCFDELNRTWLVRTSPMRIVRIVELPPEYIRTVGLLRIHLPTLVLAFSTN